MESSVSTSEAVPCNKPSAWLHDKATSQPGIIRCQFFVRTITSKKHSLGAMHPFLGQAGAIFGAMCGISVVWAPAQGQAGLSADAAQRIAAQMAAATAHRGPDGTHTHATVAGPEISVALAANRLALRGGPEAIQPLRHPQGWLAYNGELFGWPSPGSDTIMLADALAQGQLDALWHHEGMGAFAWFGEAQPSLAFARDPFGIKPLWMHECSANSLIISSEILGLRASGQLPLAFDATLLPELLAYRCTRHRVPVCAKVQAVRPGQVLLWESQRIKDVSTDNQAFTLPDASAPKPTLAAIKDALMASLLQNMEADRPIGLMLSAGIDSGLLAALGAEAGYRLPCFTAEGPEQHAAAAWAKRLGHEMIPVAVPRGTAEWLAFLRHSPAPIADPGGYMTWCVAQAAQAAGVPVLLSGAGADEVWLGYRRHAFFYRHGRWLASAPAQLLSTLDARLGGDSRPANAYRRWMAAPGNLAHFLGLPMPGCPQDLPPMPHLLWLDLFTYLPDQVLAATDLYSMAHSVEVRVPYLTRAMVQMAWGLGVDALLAQGPKTPLKQLFAQYDGSVGPKRGFGPCQAQYPDFAAIEQALGLHLPAHPLYAHLPFEAVARWRKRATPLQARMAFWSAGVQAGG